MKRSYLIVEDHKLFAQALNYMLQEVADLECIGVLNSGEEVEKFLLTKNADFIFLDINIPKTSGIELIQKLRNKGNTSKIIVVSMHTEGLVILKAMDAGANGYVPKNTTFEELRECIAQVNIGAIYLPENLKQEVARLETKHNGDWQSRNTDNKINLLSTREIEVLKLIAVGYTNKEIGEKLFLSPLTIKTHRTNILRKLGLRNSAALANYATSLGLN